MSEQSTSTTPEENVVQDECGKWHPVGWPTYRSATREEALAILQGIRYVARHETMPVQMERDAYEAACAAAGQEPMTDDEIRKASYAIQYGEFTLHGDPTGHQIIRMRLAARRRNQMVADQKARRAAAAAAAPPVEYVVCQGCGTEVPKRLMMSASMGTVCPDCYDRWS